MNTIKTIAIANDHAGLSLKPELLEFLDKNGYTVIDMGTNTAESVDYPDYASLVVSAVLDGKADAGLLICGSGIGMSIAANRRKGIRAALCHDVFTAKATRRHNDANILVMGARVIGPGPALEIADAFLSTPFSQEERHLGRIRKMD
ncbi:MAG: ribose 5-phosphate isomerase B [Defluviitaleaceae bacterium]|nr:ribose 5-phosphate isomerase B [Defluviitaleaceae bacterium]